MSEEESGTTSNVKGTIEAATGLVKAIPIYDDLVQPVAKQLGQSLELVGRAVNVALLPVKGLVWGFEEIEQRFKPKLLNKLKDVPPEDIIPPKPNVAGPAIEALRYTGHEESLSEMYANLLATAMDKNVASGAHPSFVEIIKQLTPDEAKLIDYFQQDIAFPLVTVRAVYEDEHKGGVDVAVNVSLLGLKAGLDYRKLTPSYLDNLCRLGLIEIPEQFRYIGEEVYSELESSDEVTLHRVFVEQTHKRVFELKRGGVRITNLGAQFGKVCIRGEHSASYEK